MKICGFQKTTLLDYPEHVAATVFVGGCDFRCPFCQNTGLVLHPDDEAGISAEEIFAFLKKRRGILDGVCITGGEPTLAADLECFIDEIRKLGYAIKLDTNGYHPEVLERLIAQGKLSYVAMDIKASKENYKRVAGVQNLDLGRIEKSVELLKYAGIPYEFRTTVVKGLHTVEEFERIGKWIAGARVYYLQGFRQSEWVPEKDLSSFGREEMDEMAALAARYVDRVQLRGVDETIPAAHG